LITLALNHALIFFLSVCNLELVNYINVGTKNFAKIVNECLFTLSFEIVPELSFYPEVFNSFLDLSVNDNWITPLSLLKNKLILMQMHVNPEFFV